jgi:hypothetical protein
MLARLFLCPNAACFPPHLRLACALHFAGPRSLLSAHVWPLILLSKCFAPKHFRRPKTFVNVSKLAALFQHCFVFVTYQNTYARVQ